MSNRILLAAIVSWCGSVALGLLFAACTSGRFSPGVLRLPGVIPVALLISTAAAILMTPILAWALRSGPRNVGLYGPILWLILASYIVIAIPRTGLSGPIGLLLLAIAGTVAIGLIPTAK